jgi:hypothetical protein
VHLTARTPAVPSACPPGALPPGAATLGHAKGRQSPLAVGTSLVQARGPLERAPYLVRCSHFAVDVQTPRFSRARLLVRLTPVDVRHTPTILSGRSTRIVVSQRPMPGSASYRIRSSATGCAGLVHEGALTRSEYR